MNQARRGKSTLKIDLPEENEDLPDDLRRQYAWNKYKSQNWSIIVDLFQGQLKSQLQCLTCLKVTFADFFFEIF